MSEREHPDLTRMREREARAIEQGYTEGDVNHYVQPIIGILRMRDVEGRQLSRTEVANAIDRLTKACNAERAWLAKYRGLPPVSREILEEGVRGPDGKVYTGANIPDQRMPGEITVQRKRIVYADSVTEWVPER